MPSLDGSMGKSAMEAPPVTFLSDAKGKDDSSGIQEQAHPTALPHRFREATLKSSAEHPFHTFSLE
jgi:hypothetical protein